MIDKRIFYCWFGHGEMSDLNQKCMQTWKRFCPDYEIVRIDESNYDWTANEYATIGYEHGNWSSVSNAARLEFLKHENGFYLDTDVQLVKPLDELRIFDNGFITEFDSGQPDSGVLGRGNTFPDFYQEVYDRLLPGTVLHKEFIQVLHKRYNIHGQHLVTFDDKFTLLGEEYFPTVRTGLFTDKTVGIHHFENTWTKMWTSVTDGFYPFPKVRAYLGVQMIHQDEGPYVDIKLKHVSKPWNHPEILGRTDYFFNPKVVKLSCAEFDAERIEYDKLAPQHHTVTAGGLIVTYID